jgi:hypothetical protein
MKLQHSGSPPAEANSVVSTARNALGISARLDPQAALDKISSPTVV